MQSLQSQLGGVSAKIKAEEVANKAKEEKKEPTFHMKEMARLNANPPEMHAAAKNIGMKNADKFLQSVRDPNDKDHDKNLAIFRNGYDSSEAKAEENIVAQTLREHDCHPVEKRDIAFEAKTLATCRPKGNITKTDLAHAKVLTDSLNEEWMKRGYKGTQDVIDAWNDKYGK